MAAYAFETITAQQALGIGPQDVVRFEGRGTVSLTYNIPVAGRPTVTITFGDRAVEFGLKVLDVSERGGLDFIESSSSRQSGARTAELNTTAA